MEQIEFKVSAKAARLIGRENIADVDGALIELIKNSYDADAECVFVKFDMLFPYIPKEIEEKVLIKEFDDYERRFILECYNKQDDSNYIKKTNLSEESLEKLKMILYSKNRIVVIDNGIGMSKKTISSSWMNIGTSDKEKNIYSKKGRIKTGAKGIGRFALDKLSKVTQVYTKHEDDKLISWNLDWDQFANVSLLNQVKAQVELKDIKFKTKVKEILGDDFINVEDYNWDTGTIIILSPTRENWSNRLFRKVNNNLKSINPLGSVDKFDIFLKNNYNHEFDYRSSKITSIKEDDYDYRIVADYNGKRNLTISLIRNEIDVTKKNVEKVINDIAHTFSLDEFWDREVLKKYGYSREDYAKKYKVEYDITSILKDDEYEKISQIGPFTLDLYFLRVMKGEDLISKNCITSRRRKLLSNFSGIKLYRDGFKVRPYGDDGDLYDWLGLSKRQQSSPSGVSSLTGRWRVLPYQLIGSIMISRIKNPLLEDMANREGLTQNEYYFIFRDLITEVLDKFEYDRQFIYREYKKWEEEKERSVDVSQRVVDDIKRKENKKNYSQQQSSTKDEQQSYDNNKGDSSFSTKDYEYTVSKLLDSNENQLKRNQILMAFSSAGIITNTFAHEIMRIYSDVGARVQQLRQSINRLLGYKAYNGDEDFNPFDILNEYEDTDKLLISWIEIIMKAVEKNNFQKREIRLIDIIDRICSTWEPLMKKKYIKIESVVQKDDITINIADIDFYLILNNFLLNSAMFLEENKDKERKVFISAEEIDKYVVIRMENNGPELHSKYKNNPDKIFEAGETSKPLNESTGLGMWIARDVVERNSGEIHVLNKIDGFGIEIKFLKEMRN